MKMSSKLFVFLWTYPFVLIYCCVDKGGKMELKAAKIMIGRKELCDLYKGKQVQVKAKILKPTPSTTIDKGVAKVLDDIIKRRYLGRKRG